LLVDVFITKNTNQNLQPGNSDCLVSVTSRFVFFKELLRNVYGILKKSFHMVYGISNRSSLILELF